MAPDGEHWHRDALPRGTQLNGYRFEHIIGRGGFGITYEVIDALDQHFAVKECFPRQFACREGVQVLPTSEQEEESFRDCRDRFVREARALVHLANMGAAGEGIVKVATLFEAHGTAYIVMELLRGHTLGDLMAEHPKGIADITIHGLMLRLLHALGSVHDAGILHRDIKPANIFLRENDRPVLIDFGAARAGGRGHTMTFTQIYSEGYAPIEQFSGAPQGPMSDIYAFGATFYKAIGGTTVDSFTRYQALLRGKADPQIAATQLGAGRYRQGVLAALDAALQVAPEQRPQSVRELVGLLLEDGEDTVATLRAPPQPPPPAEVTPPPRLPPSAPAADSSTPGPRPALAPPVRRKRGGLAMAAVLGVLLLAAAGMAAWHFLSQPAGPQVASGASPSAAVPAPPVTAPPTPAPPKLQPLAPAPPATPPPQAAPAPTPEEQLAEAMKKGREALDQRDFGEAMRQFRLAAQRNDPDAQIAIGILYENGLGVPQNFTEAMRWFRLAADQGSATAQYHIGYMYAEGQGVGQDLDLARQWMSKAAAHDSTAQAWLNSHPPTPPPSVAPQPAPTPQTVPSAPPPPVAGFDPRELTRQLQDELRRVGCYSGPSDGVWGASTVGGLQRFNQQTGKRLDTQSASLDTVAAVRSRADRVCAPPPPPVKRQAKKPNNDGAYDETTPEPATKEANPAPAPAPAPAPQQNCFTFNRQQYCQ